MRSFFRASLVALVAAALACGPSGEGPERGDTAPAFSLFSPEGRPVRFPADSAGRAVAIRFWSGACAFCEPEMKALGPVAEKLEKEGLTLLAVNVGETSDEVKDLAERLSLRYAVLVDESASTAKAYGVKALPTTFFVDRSGRVARRRAGEADPATFERLAREVLGSGPAR